METTTSILETTASILETTTSILETTTSILETTTLTLNASLEQGMPDPFWDINPAQWSKDIQMALMIITFILGVPGNALIVCVQAKIVNKTSTDYLVLFMALYEVFGSSTNTVVQACRYTDGLWKLVKSALMCKLVVGVYNFAQYGAGQMLGALAVDRLIKTLFPLNGWYNVKVPLAISVCILASTLTVSVPFLFIHEYDPISQLCVMSFENFLNSKYIGLVGSAMSILVFGIMSVSYSLIALSLKRRHLRKVKQHNEIPASGLADITAASITRDSTTCEETTVTDVAADTGIGTNSKQPDRRNSGDVNISVTNVFTKALGRKRLLNMERRNVNRLTVLMFLISLFYVASNILLWYLYATEPFRLGYEWFLLAYAIPMLNCISNPVMFFAMSSRFRRNVRMLFHFQSN